MADRNDPIATQLEALDLSVDLIAQHLDIIDRKIDVLETRLARIERKLEDINVPDRTWIAARRTN